MTERYFEKFPIITYGNTQAVDITERVVLTDNTLKNPYIFYPYDITDDERADQFANRYYGDSYYSWLIYLSNNIVDPYYEWYMNDDVFNDFIEKKYGSVYSAQSRIKYYQNNWVSADNISLVDYGVLSGSLKKYWEPTYLNGRSIVSYERRKLDTVLNTNRIVAYSAANTNFVSDEVCRVVFDGSHSGQGQVAFAANGYLYLKHISGTTVYTASNTSYIYGVDSGINTSITSSAQYANSVALEEEVYYSPVTYYDYEVQVNESHKTIKVLDKDYAKSVALILKDKLKNV